MSTPADQPRRTAAVTSVGGYLPEGVLTNAELEQMVATNDEWIRSRTGIRERHIARDPAEATSDMAARAAFDCLERRGLDPSEIDLIIISTVTPDFMYPSTAALVGQKIGATKAWGFDLSAACSGFLFGLATGAQFIESGAHRRVLVIGADKMSSIIDYTDRNSCILFGDGAGAVLLEPADDPTAGVRSWKLHVDGSGGDHLYQLGGGSRHPATHETVDKRMHYLVQDGKSVFKYAVVGMADVAAEVMREAGLTADDVAYLVPHQANLRIIDACAERMGLSREKVIINIDRYGNTTAATLPLCLWDAMKDGRLKDGDNLILAAFGAGFTWGALHLRWGH